MSVARFAYSALVHALLPLGLARLAWRARREPGYRAHLAERFGRYGVSRDSRPVIWLHAVSVGETHAAEPLVRALLERYPQHRILLTHTTPTGRRAGAALFGERVLQAYLPYDYPAAVARFLDRFAPVLGVLLETEIWPNLVHACKARAVPLHLVNARLSERSFRGYARVRALSREVFGALTAIAAQSEDDAQRLRALGARDVHVTGNLKFDVAAAPALVDRGRRWRADLGERRVLLAASTRDGEEALLLDALPHLPPEALLVIVPRHPQRFDEIAALLEARTLAYRRRSAGIAIAADVRVLLGDSMGEMPAYYAACDAAFVGGSLLPFGGQNLIEACAAGKPVLVGPHTYNFTQAARGAIEAGAALRVESAEELMRTAARLLQDRGALERMGERGIEFARAHQGATERVMAIITLKVPDRTA
jgi:3-deoxy-D-manno-octulosonic-acid transferase